MGNQIADSVERPSFQVMTLILSESQCNRFTEIAKEKHICRGIILQGRGTLQHHALGFLGIRSQKRVVIDILIDRDKKAEILDFVVDRLDLSKPGHGISYTTNVRISGNDEESSIHDTTQKSGVEEESMFQKLTVIVDRGTADDVMDVARKNGANGGTILHGRGTGSDCTVKLFGMDIEQEKELIIILVPNAIADKIKDSLERELELGVRGKGILFAEPVLDVRGVVENPET